MSQLLHATCVSVEGAGLLLLGDSGSGKSDLALRLIDSGAMLVSDDQVELRLEHGQVVASPPERIAGLIEARGAGLLRLPYAENVPVKLAVRLTSREEVERLPEAEFFDCLGAGVPVLSLYPFDASACAKLRLYVRGME